MPPVIQAVVSFVASTVFAITGSSVLAAYASLATLAVANFAIKAVAVIGLSRLLGPRGPKAQQAERQADVLNLTLGEGPREAIFGTAATGGSLMDAFNHGPNNEWEVQVVAVADHECDALVGFFVNDTYVAFAGDGAVSGFNSNLFVYWKNGAPGQTALNYLTINSGGAWTSNDVATGVAYITYAYKYDQKTFPTGRPTFRAVVRGLKCYDPRKDSTVAGGSGSHRWGTPSTYEWTDNAAICRYNYQRGVYTNGQLLVGPGRTADEAPPEAVIGPANICDENVALKAGGTEKRYRVSGVVRSDEPWLSVEEDFAAAMAGDLVERSGALFIDPGAAKSSVFSFTDDDLVFDQPVTVQAKVSRRELVNTVAAAYIEPTRLWQSTSAPLRRSLTDITTDGEVRERSLDLRFVTSQAQAQRLAEIERRKMRLQRTATVVLGPAACILEAGDWVTWTSARYHGGAARTYQIVGVAIDEKLQTSLQLREINSNVYAWTASSDELDLLAPAYTAPGAMPAATISGFNATAVSITGSSGSQVPAISCTWTAPTDPSIYAITFEWRKVGDTNVLKATHLRPQDGVIVLAGGITSTVDFEVRAIPETDPERDETPTAWRTVTSTALAAATAAIAAGITGQGSLATANFVLFGTNVRRSDGTTVVTDAAAITSLGTAAAISGQGSLATQNSAAWGSQVSGRPGNLAALGGSEAINNALVPVGRNALINSDWETDTSGWVHFGATNAGSGTIVSGRNLSGYGGSPRNVLWSRLIMSSGFTSAVSGFYFFGWMSAGFDGGLGLLRRYGLPVKAGDRVYIRALGSVHGAVGFNVRIRWWGYDGSFVSEVDASSVIGDARLGGPSGGSGNPQNYAEVGGIYTAPAGATFATFGYYATGPSASQTDCYIFMTEPMIAVVAAGQTTPPAYNSGPPEKAADVTIERTASAVSGQGALATKSTIITADVTANAITATSAQFNAASISIGTSYVTLATISITAEAGDVIDLGISAYIALSTSRTFTSVGAVWKIARGGTTIYETTTVEGDRGLTDDVQFGGRGLVAANVLDTPGAGTHTYTLEMYRSGGIGGAATNRYLRALRLRR